SCLAPQPSPAVLDRLCVHAAGLLRDKAETVWPANPATARQAAPYFDLSSLARRARPRLRNWTGRVTPAEAAELRLLLRDAAGAAPDGAPRMVEILFANLADAALILRLISHASGAAGDDQFLATSELSDFGDRLFRAAEARADRVCAFDPAGGDAAQAAVVGQDIAFVAEFLEELTLSLEL